ncbi:MAG: hypothetical protein JWL83_521 [Actinomycetia bacterium]|nr:hypothetical protein [Actinomycetes bacterium]
MRKHPFATLLVALSVPVLGGAAYAVTQHVNTRPASTVVIPPVTVSTPARHHKTTPTSVDDRLTRATTPTSFDDHGNHSGSATTPTSVDDHGGNRGTTPTSIDDHGGNATTPTSVDDHGGSATTPTSIDDHGGSRGGGSGSGRDGSGSGHGGRDG